MRKLKRTAAAALAGLMAAAMTGCGITEKLGMFLGSKETPYERYEAAQKLLNEAEGMEIDIDGDIRIEMSGISLDMGYDMDCAMEGNISDSGMKMAMDMKMDVMGNQMDASYWYSDGYYYMDAMGQKVMYPMAQEDIQGQINGQIGMGLQKESDFKSIEAEKDGSTYRITYVVSGEKMQGLLETVMNAIGQEADIELNLEDAKGVMVVDEDNVPLSNQISMEMQVEAEGQQMEMALDMDVAYGDIGSHVSVTLPDVSQFRKTESPSAA